MDFEKLAGPIARLAATLHDAGARPVLSPPGDLGRPLSLQDMHDLKAMSIEGGDDVLGEWATKTLNRIAGRTPPGADGGPISWPEACAEEHPYVVATKAFCDPAYAHLVPQAREYMAASPTRAPLSAVEVQGDESVAQKAAENHTGAMVALVPSAAQCEQLALYGTEDADELHVTLYYPGQVADLDDDGLDKLLPRLRTMASVFAPLSCRVAGLAVFNPTGDNPAHVLVLNSPAIMPVKERASNIVERNLSAELVPQHEPYIPHVTLGYGGMQPNVPREVFDQPLVLDRLRLAWGDVDIDIPLTGEK